MHLLKPLSRLKPCFLKHNIILAIFSLLFIVSCKENNLTEKPQEVKEQREEKLKNSEISGAFQVKSLKDNTENLGNLIFEFNSEDQKLNVTTDCNNLWASYKLNGSDIKFSDIFSTRKFCEDQMENEKLISELLPKVEKFKFNTPQELNLMSVKNTVLVTLIKTEKSE